MGRYNLALAPDSMAADTGPVRDREPRKEFGENSLVFSDAGKSSDGVSLTGTRAAALCFDGAALEAVPSGSPGPLGQAL